MSNAQLKTGKQKKVREKRKPKANTEEIVTNMVDMNPTISIIILKVNYMNMTI